MAILSRNSYSFPVPEVYTERDYHKPPVGDYFKVVSKPIPQVVKDTLMHYLPPSVPISQSNVFVGVRNGSLPPFLINYFIALQGKSVRVSPSTKFFRALHLLEAVRTELQGDVQPSQGHGQPLYSHGLKLLPLPPTTPVSASSSEQTEGDSKLPFKKRFRPS